MPKPPAPERLRSRLPPGAAEICAAAAELHPPAPQRFCGSQRPFVDRPILCPTSGHVGRRFGTGKTGPGEGGVEICPRPVFANPASRAYGRESWWFLDRPKSAAGSPRVRLARSRTLDRMPVPYRAATAARSRADVSWLGRLLSLQSAPLPAICAVLSRVSRLQRSEEQAILRSLRLHRNPREPRVLPRPRAHRLHRGLAAAT